MQRLVDELLDLARYRSATIRLQLRRFDAVELSQSIVATSGPLASRRHQEVTLHVPAGQALPVYGDRPRLEQALLNLITNAHHFAPDAGSVDVRLEGASGGLVQWFIKNDGPGIAIAEQARLFERFFVGGHSVPRSEAGLGLGLPTALSIAQAHGGTIDVSSRPGHGSTFTLSIPAAGPAAVRLSTGMPDDAP
jgi:signal transduction histidine kinase